MALNRTDTRQRAYNRIDTSNPKGNWIDEPSFNKSTGGCLMGNWWEERELSKSMTEREKNESITSSTIGSPRVKGGMESTKFLINPLVENTTDKHFLTTNKNDFNETSSSLPVKRSKVGTMKERRMAEIVATAVAATPEEKPPKNYFSTSYKEATANVNPPPKIPAEISDYVSDQPITLYTGNPTTGAKMTLPGCTAQTGKSRHAINSNFSIPIDRHPIGGKHQTHQF